MYPIQFLYVYNFNLSSSLASCFFKFWRNCESCSYIFHCVYASLVHTYSTVFYLCKFKFIRVIRSLFFVNVNLILLAEYQYLHCNFNFININIIIVFKCNQSNDNLHFYVICSIYMIHRLFNYLDFYYY